MKNNKNGFTLVELVIVVAVMAILVAVAIPTVSSITATATSNVAKTNAQTIESMLKLEMADTNAQSLNEAAVANAIVDAKLGIDSGSFVYTLATGSVDVAAEGASGSATAFLITFTAAGEGETTGTIDVVGAKTVSDIPLDGSTVATQPK